MRHLIEMPIYGLLFMLITDSIWWLLIREHFTKRWSKILFWGVTFSFIIGFIVCIFTFPNISEIKSYNLLSVIIGTLIAWYVPKILYIFIRLIGMPFTLIGEKSTKFVKGSALLLAAILFGSCVYGFTIGRYNYKINEVEVPIENLPRGLQGVKIVHLSDLHLGSISDSYSGIAKLVEDVNKQNADLVLFTGDFVNNVAEEALPFIPTLKEIKARYGVYGVLGNHDYGDYHRWSSKAEKAANLRKLIENEEQAGIKLLLNENVKIPIGHDTLLLAGVENWGKPPFPRYGDLEKALKDRGNLTTVLMSHDPSHWQGQVIFQNVPLTLSGHTHAMQMGIQIGKFKWSPSKYLYPEYDGLYSHNGCYLNVSRGQGYLAMPGRIGLRPSIDVITLINK